MATLEIKDLHVSVEDQEILHGVNLKIESGQIAGIMGRNGSGKSTLAKTIFGHPDYEVTKGDILFNGESILEKSTDERARMGLFLGFQSPIAIEGVTLSNFLRTALHLKNPDQKLENPIKFHRRLKSELKELGLEESFISRGVNENASGGERKKAEIIQLKNLKPKIAVLDEIDSGLDIDALRAVADAIIKEKEESGTGFLLITHYNRLLTHTKPDVVYLMHQGKIVRQGGPELAQQLEEKGYEALVSEVTA
ncbi:MAG: Fe-S cluster assembly ATPase SufC [Methanobacteriota archaeon]|nr:MAG: Fe-S cluster assembly ATPase SufC [Euryarchaeota archaeon]